MLEIPHKRAEAITPNDSTSFNKTRGLYVGSAGALRVTMANGVDVTFGAVIAGSFLPISVSKVFSTGTVASNIVALY